MKIGIVDISEVKDIYTAVCVITPHIASELLKRNTRNRKIKPGVVSKYAREIIQGEWFPTASGIGFDQNGVLIDGQHRLAAIVEANRQASVLIATNLPSVSQEKVDRQAKRSLYDVFSINGMAHSITDVQVATVIAKLTIHGRIDQRSFCSDSDVKNALQNHGEKISEVLGIMKSCAKNRGTGRAAIIAVMVLFYEKNKEKMKDFIERFISGENMSFNCPPMRLRRWALEGTNSAGGGAAQAEDLGKTIYACKSWIDGKQIDKLLKAEWVNG